MVARAVYGFIKYEMPRGKVYLKMPHTFFAIVLFISIPPLPCLGIGRLHREKNELERGKDGARTSCDW